ncbi:MAG: hypothetical protein J4478_00505 [Candidatus Diapherotrites archaeon]|uniref:Uncharacterized protein n=1 Tax=Candidatus Iainarchaeum sp. TaxID=3101447 RepID=A0A7J4JZR1_9ARCH|nr:hypothetical protein [Candidatus Diapherotrites archaeon]HIH21377.1 hypothetical protein [Candidatus Diapherotrites archaeon]HIH32698.1 hypothetical protein [Candidatus Diapherotrites archaeon]
MKGFMRRKTPAAQKARKKAKLPTLATNAKPVRISLAPGVAKMIAVKPLYEKIWLLSHSTNFATSNKMTVREIALFLGMHEIEVKELLEKKQREEKNENIQNH